MAVQSVCFLGTVVASMTPIELVYEILQQQFPDSDLRREAQPAVSLP
jgi:hypothetical protein